jgi:type III secretion protein U
MGEKTEEATPKKLRDAKKKGQVAKSQDMPSAFTFIVSVYACVALSSTLYNQLGDFTVSTFSLIGHSNLEIVIPQLYYQAAIAIFIASMPIMAIVCVIGVLVNFLTVGPIFALEVFKFDPKKFDPIQNLKSKFKLKTLVELLKSTLKLAIAGYIIYAVMMDSLPVLTKTVSMPMLSALMIFNAFLMEVVAKVGLFFIVIAVADFLYQKKTFAKEMRMEKFEVKQEYKNSEGDPHIKGKRKQIAQEIAYSDGPAGGVKKAAAIVTNPTHIAVAIGYDRDIDAAPYVILMGKDLLAERIIKLADQYNVPIVRNIRLAHRLWEAGELYQYIPEDTYEALAEILRWINSLNTEYQFDYNGEK